MNAREVLVKERVKELTQGYEMYVFEVTMTETVPILAKSKEEARKILEKNSDEIFEFAEIDSHFEGKVETEKDLQNMLDAEWHDSQPYFDNKKGTSHIEGLTCQEFIESFRQQAEEEIPPEHPGQTFLDLNA